MLSPLEAVRRIGLLLRPTSAPPRIVPAPRRVPSFSIRVQALRAMGIRRLCSKTAHYWWPVARTLEGMCSRRQKYSTIGRRRFRPSALWEYRPMARAPRFCATEDDDDTFIGCMSCLRAKLLVSFTFCGRRGRFQGWTCSRSAATPAPDPLSPFASPKPPPTAGSRIMQPQQRWDVQKMESPQQPEKNDHQRQDNVKNSAGLTPCMRGFRGKVNRGPNSCAERNLIPLLLGT